ncbi:hypothetical protein CERZMDRAFT_119817 [Cercospora zeae-maydis SCOH1-5]|uniref:Uncharacterized protein n=1 Tax=Cercospora zeae-maydis SCOH1-5 TaxID=717836 RepID=A0A6A6FSN0_9PEZI|nr:hypothetical protein CERZMDRAFT_119817 [Cercospora zeae-maydis SCOH1-5]
MFSSNAKSDSPTRKKTAKKEGKSKAALRHSRSKLRFPSQSHHHHVMRLTWPSRSSRKMSKVTRSPSRAKPR